MAFDKSGITSPIDADGQSISSPDAPGKEAQGVQAETLPGSYLITSYACRRTLRHRVEIYRLITWTRRLNT
jgi:hypothetical protein